MSLYKRKDSEVWWIDLRHRSRRVRRSTGTADKAAAQRQHDELKARLWTEKQAGRTFADALLEWIKAKPRTERDLNYIRRIRAMYADRPLIDVDEPSIRTAIGHCKPGTYNRTLAVFRASLNLAKQAGWIENVPTLRRKQEPAAEARFIRADDWLRLRRELPEHLGDMADFSIATGLRWSNVCQLAWDNVSLARRTLTIRAGDAKARKAIVIPLSDDAIAVLQRRAELGESHVFTYKGRPILSPRTAFNKARKRAGLDSFTWHGLRHTWASWHAMNGTPMDVLQKLGGWETREMVERYAQLSPGYVAQYAGNAKPLATEKKRKRG